MARLETDKEKRGEVMKVKCWKCGGKGWLFDHLVGIFTFGLGYLVCAVDGLEGAKEGRGGNILCPICEGKGYQESEVSDDQSI